MREKDFLEQAIEHRIPACTAIVLAAGAGKRMGTVTPKQYLSLLGKPLLYYTLAAFQRAGVIREIILVTEKHQIGYCREVFVRQFGLNKISCVVCGGAERFDSVYEGLKACQDADYVFIHDGVRPFVTEDMMMRGLQAATQYGAAVAGMPSKDTVKIADGNGRVKETPPRNLVWSVQTPQVFRYEIIKEAYDRLQTADKTGITDDAMVVEKMTGKPVYLYEGAYTNIKITTPEDLEVAETFLPHLFFSCGEMSDYDKKYGDDCHGISGGTKERDAK